MAKKTKKKKVAGNTLKKKKKVVQKTHSAAGARSGRRKTSGRKTVRKVQRTAGKSPVIHCMLAPTEEDILLLPTSVLAEVVDFQQPSPMYEAPPWLIGQIEWEKRQVPVFSFFALINGGDPGEISSRSKIMVIKSLTGSGRVPYLGVLLSDLPRMTYVKEFDLEQTGDKSKSLGVFSRIRLEDLDAIIPDLDRLTHLITHATYGTLPITQLDD
jgi:chemosensory pili system protein ChpC